MSEINFSKVRQGFIGYSSPLTGVVALYNPAELTDPAFVEGGFRLLSVLGSHVAPVPEGIGGHAQLRQLARS
jgi:hypothetical protein